MAQIRRIAFRRLGWLIAVAAALSLAIALPAPMRTAAGFAARSLLEMAPVIVLAVLVSALVRATGADGLLSRAFAQRGIAAIVLSAAIGAVTPICGVGVLPIVASLLGAGVPLAPVMAFWLASPVTDPGMLAITVGTLGLPFAVAKTAAAAFIGIGGGLATAGLVRAGAFATPLKGCAASGCGPLGAARDLEVRFWRDPSRRALFRSDAWDAATLIVKWLTVAFLLEGLLQQYLPASLVAQWVGRENPWAIPLSVGLGAPIYLDGYAALPLVRGLLDKGMGQGAAMAFLIAGGVTSLYASVAVWALVRLPVFLWYLLLAVGFSLATGYGWQLLSPLFAL